MKMEYLIELLKANPMLVAGIGTVVTGSAVYLIRAIPQSILTSLIGMSVSTLHAVNSDNEDGIILDAFINKYRFGWDFRHYRVDTSENDSAIMPGLGGGYGLWKGTLFHFERSLNKNTMYQPVVNVTLTLYTRSSKRVEEAVREGERLSKKLGLVQEISVSTSGYWRNHSDRVIRPLSTIFVSDGVDEQIILDMEKFRNSEARYIKQGIPYKFAAILKGPPGTGKTSLVAAIAGYFNLKIRYVTGLYGIDELLTRTRPDELIVIDDVDTLLMQAAKKQQAASEDDEEDETDVGSIAGAPAVVKESKKVTVSIDTVIHTMLNTIDGFLTPHGLQVIMTTNFPERLDDRLMRPGRIDKIYHIGPLDADAADRMFFAFTDKNLSDFDRAWRAWFKPLVGSKMQELIMHDDPKTAFQNVKAYCEKAHV